MSGAVRGWSGGASRRGSRVAGRGATLTVPTTMSFLAGCVPGTSVTLPDGSVLTCPGLVPPAGMSGLRGSGACVYDPSSGIFTTFDDSPTGDAAARAYASSIGVAGLRDVEPDSGSPTGTGAQAPSGAGGFTSADRSTVRKSLAVIAALIAAWALGRSG